MGRGLLIRHLYLVLLGKGTLIVYMGNRLQSMLGAIPRITIQEADRRIEVFNCHSGMISAMLLQKT